MIGNYSSNKSYKFISYEDVDFNGLRVGRNYIVIIDSYPRLLSFDGKYFGSLIPDFVLI